MKEYCSKQPNRLHKFLSCRSCPWYDACYTENGKQLVIKNAFSFSSNLTLFTWYVTLANQFYCYLKGITVQKDKDGNPKNLILFFKKNPALLNLPVCSDFINFANVNTLSPTEYIEMMMQQRRSNGWSNYLIEYIFDKQGKTIASIVSFRLQNYQSVI